MTCNDFKKWLIDRDRIRTLVLPDELVQHCDQCPVCQEQLAGVKSLQVCLHGRKLAEPAKKRIRNRIMSELVPVIKSASSPESVFQFPRWFQFVAVGGAFVIFLIWFAFPGKNVSKPSQTVSFTTQRLSVSLIQGSGTLNQQSLGSLTTIPVDGVCILAKNSVAMVRYPGFGIATFSGAGAFKTTSNGFAVQEGKFQIAFKRDNKPFLLRVFAHQFLITGTIVNLTVREASATLTLIEGEIKATLFGKVLETTVLKTGQKVTMNRKQARVLHWEPITQTKQVVKPTIVTSVTELSAPIPSLASEGDSPQSAVESAPTTTSGSEPIAPPSRSGLGSLGISGS